MSEIDTDFIRDVWPRDDSDSRDVINDLCDALDAARDAFLKEHEKHTSTLNRAMHQMEEIDVLRERAEKAEAAIERVRALCNESWFATALGEHVLTVSDVEDALGGSDD